MFICFYIGHEWVSLGSEFRFRFPDDANKLRIGLTPFRLCRVRFTIIYIYLPLSISLSLCLYIYVYIYRLMPYAFLWNTTLRRIYNMQSITLNLIFTNQAIGIFDIATVTGHRLQKRRLSYTGAITAVINHWKCKYNFKFSKMNSSWQELISLTSLDW